MGYTTNFSGGISIRPKLPDEYVRLFNEIASKRNNSYGDGDEGSFDHLLYGHLGPVQGEGPTSVPGCWCQWELFQQDPEFTMLQWDGGEKFYQYPEWLAFVIGLIKRDFPGSCFEGSIEWEGEDPDDKGKLSADEAGAITSHYGTTVYESQGPVEGITVPDGLKSHRVMSRVVLAKLG